jgi:hypothetical protein
MNAQEKALIDSVFDRLAQGTVSQGKDAEAMAHIQERLARQPDSVYGLVQAVLLQEMALNQASARVAELERQVAQSGGQAQGSGFLGGAGPWGRVPATPAPQQQYAPPPQPQAGSPWGQPMQSSGGGFLHNVASMAAGVAAGSLLADGIASLFGGRHMFGGGYGGFGGLGGFGGAGAFGVPPNVENITINNYGPDGIPGNGVPDGNSVTDGANYRDASFDPSAGDDGLPDAGGGFDDGGFDSSDV